MRTTDGRKMRGERSRAAILTRATLIASQDGLEHLTIGRVANDAGVAKSNIQVLFGDKETLQIATMENGLAIYREEVVAPAMLRPTPLARLTALIEGWFTFVESRKFPGGCMTQSLSNEYRTRPGPIRARVKQYRAESRKRLLDLLLQAKADGEIRADSDVEQIAFELQAYQAAANVAALMDENELFERARKTSLERLRAIRCQ